MPCCFQGGLEIVEPAGDVLFEHGPEMGVDGVELLARREAVDGGLGDAGDVAGAAARRPAS